MFTIRLVMIAACVLAAGCGGAGNPDYDSPAPARGKVLVNGQPGRLVRVTFLPTDGKGKEALADTALDGTFTLSTFQKADGAVPGRYVITLETVPGTRGTRIPPRYAEMDTTEFRGIEVKSGQDNMFELSIR